MVCYRVYLGHQGHAVSHVYLHFFTGDGSEQYMDYLSIESICYVNE